MTFILLTFIAGSLNNQSLFINCNTITALRQKDGYTEVTAKIVSSEARDFHVKETVKEIVEVCKK